MSEPVSLAADPAAQLDEVCAELRRQGVEPGAVEYDPAAALRDLLTIRYPPPAPAEAAPEPPGPKPRYIPAGFQPRLRDLVPGTVIRRYTTNTPAGVDSTVPCCERPIPLPTTDGSDLFGCSYCHVLYTVAVIDEGDGGYGAEFTVHEARLVLARRHHTRKATP